MANADSNWLAKAWFFFHWFAIHLVGMVDLTDSFHSKEEPGSARER